MEYFRTQQWGGLWRKGRKNQAFVQSWSFWLCRPVLFRHWFLESHRWCCPFFIFRDRLVLTWNFISRIQAGSLIQESKIWKIWWFLCGIIMCWNILSREKRTMSKKQGSSLQTVPICFRKWIWLIPPLRLSTASICLMKTENGWAVVSTRRQWKIWSFRIKFIKKSIPVFWKAAMNTGIWHMMNARMCVCVYTMGRWRSPAAALFPLEKVRWIRCFPKQKNIRKAAGWSQEKKDRFCLQMKREKNRQNRCWKFRIWEAVRKRLEIRWLSFMEGKPGLGLNWGWHFPRIWSMPRSVPPYSLLQWFF